MSFKDVNGTEIKLGDYLYHAASAHSSAWLNRVIVIGFSPQKIRAVKPERVKKYRRDASGYVYDSAGRAVMDETDEWRGPTNISPGDRVVVVNDDWPLAEQYLRDNYLWHLKETA